MEENILIGQAASILGCTRSCLRYYESEFNLSIPRGKNNKRVYSSKELEMFRYIYKLKSEGMSNTQIKAVLSSDRVEKCSFDESIFEPKTAEQPAGDTLILMDLISELLREIGELKKVSGYSERSDLMRENDDLKSKLKEKTYELVEIREKLNSIKKAGSKKLFKI